MSQDDCIVAWGNVAEYKKLGLEVFQVVNKEDVDGAQLNGMDNPDPSDPAAISEYISADRPRRLRLVASIVQICAFALMKKRNLTRIQVVEEIRPLAHNLIYRPEEYLRELLQQTDGLSEPAALAWAERLMTSDGGTKS